MRETREPFGYVLNRFEAASQHAAPASVGYGDKRRAVLDYVASLESALAQAEAERDAARAALERSNERVSAALDALLTVADWPAGVVRAYDLLLAAVDPKWEAEGRALPASPPGAAPTTEGSDRD